MPLSSVLPNKPEPFQLQNIYAECLEICKKEIVRNSLFQTHSSTYINIDLYQFKILMFFYHEKNRYKMLANIK